MSNRFSLISHFKELILIPIRWLLHINALQPQLDLSFFGLAVNRLLRPAFLPHHLNLFLVPKTHRKDRTLVETDLFIIYVQLTVRRSFRPLNTQFLAIIRLTIKVPILSPAWANNQGRSLNFASSRPLSFYACQHSPQSKIRIAFTRFMFVASFLHQRKHSSHCHSFPVRGQSSFFPLSSTTLVNQSLPIIFRASQNKMQSNSRFLSHRLLPYISGGHMYR